MSRESHREIVAFVLLAIAAFLGVCVHSHHPEDWLDAGAVRNVGGPLGAAASYHLTIWVGRAGAYGVVAGLGLVGLSLFFRRRIEAWGWKLVGGVLGVLTLACFEVAVFDLSGRPSTLPGGYFGTWCYGLLLGNLSTFGTYLILVLAALVAFVISTDTVLYPAVRRSREVLLDPARLEAAVVFLRDKAPAPALAGIGGLRQALGRVTPRRSPGTKKKKKKKKKKRGEKAARRRVSPEAGAGPEGRRRARTDVEDDPLALEVHGPGGAPPAGGTSTPADADGEEDSEWEWEWEWEDVEEEVDPDAEDADEGEDAEEDGAAADASDEEPDARPEAEDAARGDDEEAQEPREANDVAAEARGTAGGSRSAGEITIREPDELTPRKRKAKGGTKSSGPYRLPTLDHIEAAPLPENYLDRNALTKTAGRIETTLQNFKIDAQVVEAQKGPTITQFEVSLAAGIKVHKIINLADDLAMALKAQSIRIIAPIPGKSTVGIEVPNRDRSTVGLRELIEISREDPKRYQLPLALGRDTAGNPVIGDLGEMPHLLIAGSTGSGKSVCINSIIVSFLMTRSPEEVKLILVDPKMVELAQFEKIPHLLSPVVTDMKKAPAVLNWLVEKMEERYELLALAGVRHIASYNDLGPAKLRERLAGKMDDDEIENVPEKLPSVVVVIDELADLMMTAAKEIEGSITRLSQKSRAVGIHVILATQRPSVDVITGLIKANMPSRVSFRVTSRVDSRTILDRNGAEKLLGKGDCLYLPPGTSDVMRVQGAYISDREIRSVVDATAREAEPQYNPELTRFGIEGAQDGDEEDDLFEDAVRIVLGSQRGSTTLLQRQLQIGYTRASRLMEILCERGLVGPFQGSKSREVYYTLEEWEKSQDRKKKASSGE